MKKILLTATVQSHICQFHRPLVRMLHAEGYEIHVAARNNLVEKNGLKLDFVDKVFDIPFSRSPISIDNINAYKDLKAILKKEHYDVIHCNTPMGGVVTRLAANAYRKTGTIVVYTAHGFHFYKGSSLSSWLIYYPIEYVLGKLFTDKLITVSNEDFQLATRKGLCEKVYRIHGVGINEQKYHLFSEEEVKIRRNELKFAEGDFVGVCTGELNKNKRQILVINALPKIVHEVPNFKIMFAGNGPEHEALQAKITELGMNAYAHMIGYCPDLQNYVKVADFAISASKREGMPMNLLEAMACEKPVIGSVNRGHREYIQDGINGFLVNDENISEQIANRIICLAKDKDLYMRLSKQALLTADAYKESQVEKELFNIYFKD